MKPRVVLVSRTRFDEPPRLRHQIARLLAAAGHEVLFVQRPGTLSRGRIATAPMEPGITVADFGELLHHQLRPVAALSTANAAVARWSLVPIARAWQDAVVVNFNYDYALLRDLWPAARLLTVINDDFQFTARPWMKREARRVQRETLRRSDHTVAVSYPLLRQCREDTEQASLFLPWARVGYVAPPASGERQDLLYWGFIENRIDWDLIERLAASGTRLHFVGPIDRCPRAHEVFKHPGITYHGPAALKDIPAVLAQCAASILPYDLNRSSLEITISNRAFEILGYGIPLLYAAFPDLIAAPEAVIRKCSTFEDYIAGLHATRAGFESAQPLIRDFLADHTPSARYRQLAGLLFP